MIRFRQATEADVPAVVALLGDDSLGARREGGDDAGYLAAFRRMQSEGANQLIVGEDDGPVIATYQITFISGLRPSGGIGACSRRSQGAGDRRGADARRRGSGPRGGLRALAADHQQGPPRCPPVLRTARLYPIPHWL